MKGGPALVKEVERRMRVVDGIIRQLSVRVDQEIRKGDARKAARATEDAGKRSRQAERVETAAFPGEEAGQ